MRLNSVILVAPLTALASCGTMRGETVEVGSHFMLGGSGFVKGGYSDPPVVDKSDFQPPNGSMSLDTNSRLLLEGSAILNLHLRLSQSFYIGLESYYLSLSLAESQGCDGVNCMALRQTDINWWNIIPAEDVVLSRSPSLGWVFGYMFGRPKDSGLNGWGLVEYSIAIRTYNLDVNTYEGVDCRGCPNGVILKNSTTVEKGLVLRNSIKLGGGLFFGVVWVETMSDRVLVGGGIGFLGDLVTGDHD